jgi:hypothetical protein
VKIDQVTGLNLVDEPHEVGATGLVVGDNVDITTRNKVRRRGGRQRVYTGVIDAAWGDGEGYLFVEGSALKRLLPDYTAEELANSITHTGNLWACRHPAGMVYWSNGVELGVIVGGTNRPWGLPTPATPVVSQAAAGSMRQARYLVALSFERNGEEGPLSEHALFVGDTGVSIPAITVTTELTLAGVTGVNLYLTGPDGSELYLAGTYALGSTILYQGDCSEFSVPADTMFLNQMPPCEDIVYFAGRLWTAALDMLLYTRPYHEMLDLREDFIPMGERIAAHGAVSDGLYVATLSETYFFAGTDPAEMIPDLRADFGAIPGTMVEVDGRVVGEGSNVTALMWASPRGICVGLPGGQVVNLTERRVNTLMGERGTAFLRQVDGQSHYVAVVQEDYIRSDAALAMPSPVAAGYYPAVGECVAPMPIVQVGVAQAAVSQPLAVVSATA